MIENNYAITIVREYVSGQTMYKTTVGKFPDVLIYTHDPHAGFDEAVDVVRDLIEMAHDMNHPIPEQDYIEPLMI